MGGWDDGVMVCWGERMGEVRKGYSVEEVVEEGRRLIKVNVKEEMEVGGVKEEGRVEWWLGRGKGKGCDGGGGVSV